jgi:hypothetical protein
LSIHPTHAEKTVAIFCHAFTGGAAKHILRREERREEREERKEKREERRRRGK